LHEDVEMGKEQYDNSVYPLFEGNVYVYHVNI